MQVNDAYQDIAKNKNPAALAAENIITQFSDIEPPVVESATLHLQDGRLVLTFSETINIQQNANLI